MKCVWALIVLFVHGPVVEAFESKVVSTFKDARSNGRITNQCNDTLALFIENLQSEDDPWVLKMLDATSKIPVGILFSYNIGELGQFDQCLDTESQDGLIKAKYCIGQLSLSSIGLNATKGNLAILRQQVQLRETSRRITNLNLRDEDDGAAGDSVDSLMTWAICRFGDFQPTVFLLWAMCIAVSLTCVFAGHSTLRGVEYDRWGNAFYIALVRPVWSLCLAWVILACVLGYGGPINTLLSLPIYQVLNRFTYSMYLLHLAILLVISSSSKRSIYFSFFEVAYFFWGITMFTFGLSVLWVLAFESPMIVVEKFIFKGINRIMPNGRTNSQKSESPKV